MNVKEIKKSDKEAKEINVSDDSKKNEEWEEKNIEAEEDKQEKETFSIGDTMLARGDAVESWGAKNLEDTISNEEIDRDFESEDFEEEEMEEDGFSYEATSENSIGGLYGETISSGDLYGGKDASVGDLYGTTKRDDSVSMYNTGGGSASESSLYNVNTTRGKTMMGVEYKIEGPRKKKSSVRRTSKSGLETGIKKKRRSKGVSLF